MQLYRHDVLAFAFISRWLAACHICLRAVREIPMPLFSPFNYFVCVCVDVVDLQFECSVVGRVTRTINMIINCIRRFSYVWMHLKYRVIQLVARNYIGIRKSRFQKINLKPFLRKTLVAFFIVTSKEHTEFKRQILRW